MSYYILPKKNNQVNISPKFEEKETLQSKPKPLISHSLIHYLNKQKEQCLISEEILKVVNNYEFLFSKVPGYKFSVSKMRPPSEKFYLLMELTHIFNLFDPFSKKDISTMHFCNCPEASIECLDILREDNQDIHIPMNDLFQPIENPQFNNIHSIEFMYFDNDENKCNSENESDIKNNNYDSDFNSLLLAFLNILIYQSNNGVSVIKINQLFYRPILDIIFLLTGAYEKVYIIKPNTSNTFKNERFLVCKCFIGKQYNNIYIENLKRVYLQKVLIKESKPNFMLTSLMDCDLPYYFLNKIDESNIIIGQQQLDAYDQAINLMKNKNKEDKIENLKKSNIQKCIQMCEKFKIPYNKFAEKVNIFLQGHSILHENGGDQESIPNIFLYPSTRVILNDLTVAVEETETETETETKTETEIVKLQETEDDNYPPIEHIIKNIIEKIINDI